MPDITEDVVGALAAYFPPAIARAVLRSAVRRGGLAETPREQDLAELLEALERTLPMYIVDAKRRGECVESVRRLVRTEPRDPGVAPPSPPPSRPRAQRDTPRAPAESPRPDRPVESPRPDRAERVDLEAGLAGLRPESVTVRVRSARDVVQACDLARSIAKQVGFSLLDQTKVATVASELARNILLYVGDGEVRVAALEAPRRGIEIVAKDTGPGITDVGLVLGSGYRSKTGMGMGLKGAKRLMDEFEIESRMGVGTTVFAKKLVS
jgi:serine/threonine-protein kinase RsbT